MAVLYISDLHFGHDEVIPHDRRPFRDVLEMDQVMIERWNRNVQPQDHVYIVGDFAFRNEPEPQKYLQKLCGLGPASPGALADLRPYS